jgi:hypothetical protein
MGGRDCAADADAHTVYARVCSPHELTSACDGYVFVPYRKKNLDRKMADYL